MNEQGFGSLILDPRTIETLQGICEEVDPNFLNELIEMYVAQGPGWIAKIKESAAAGLGEELEAAAHRLKGSTLNLGGVRMAEVCNRLETKGRKKDLTELPGLLEGLEESYVELICELDKLRKPQQP